MKYKDNPHLFAQKLSKIMIDKGMIDKKGKPDKVALYNLLYPNDLITEETRKNDSQFVVDKTRTISNWLNGKNYPKKITDVFLLCNTLDCDLDYFFTDMHAPTHNIEFISLETGLSNNAINMLKILLDYKNRYSSLLPGLCADTDVINIILEYQFIHTKEREDKNFPSWSIFHYIKQYLSSGNYERELQDRLRISDGAKWVDIEKNDIVTKNKKSYEVLYKEAINSKSGSGLNSKTVNVVNTKKDNERYVLEIDKLFCSYSKDNIFRELDKIKEYLELKEGDNQ